MSTSQRRVSQTALLKYLNRRFKVVVCEKCGTANSLTVDHVIPLASGGKNDESNIRILCLDCQKEYHGTTAKKRTLR
jgi:5-methylcytosine-specific restriction endonuclease McrA